MPSRSLLKLASRIARPKGQPVLPALQVVNGTVVGASSSGLARISDSSPSVTTITVKIGADTVQAPYLGPAPSVGDVVWVLVGGGPVRVLGVPTGFPTF